MEQPKREARANSVTSYSSVTLGSEEVNPKRMKTDSSFRESFDNIYLDLSKEPGKCRLAESGLGWKPAGGQTFTLDKQELISAQWSRAAKAYELKIYARHAGVVQLDGFKQEVS